MELKTIHGICRAGALRELGIGRAAGILEVIDAAPDTKLSNSKVKVAIVI